MIKNAIATRIQDLRFMDGLLLCELFVGGRLDTLPAGLRFHSAY